MTNVWQLLTIIAIGILAGYLFEKYATNQDINYMAFSIIFFSIIGIINFFVSILKGVKKLEKTDKDKKRILLVLIADSCHFSYAPHRRYGSHVDERCLRSFLCTYYVPFNSSDGSRQQCDGKTFRSHLPISRRDLLPSLYHTFSADLYADSLGTESSGRTFRHACFACSFHLHFIHCYRIFLP